MILPWDFSVWEVTFFSTLSDEDSLIPAPASLLDTSRNSSLKLREIGVLGTHTTVSPRSPFEEQPGLWLGLTGGLQQLCHELAESLR